MDNHVEYEEVARRCDFQPWVQYWHGNYPTLWDPIIQIFNSSVPKTDLIFGRDGVIVLCINMNDSIKHQEIINLDTVDS